MFNMYIKQLSLLAPIDSPNVCALLSLLLGRPQGNAVWFNLIHIHLIFMSECNSSSINKRLAPVPKLKQQSLLYVNCTLPCVKCFDVDNGRHLLIFSISLVPGLPGDVVHPPRPIGALQLNILRRAALILPGSI